MANGNDKSEHYKTLADVHSLLDEVRTTGNGWHISARTYKTGDVEVIAHKLGYEDSLRRGGGATRKSQDKAQMDESTLQKSRRRSARTVHQKLLQLEADTLLTLTYQENQTDLDIAWKQFKAFSRKMKKRYKHWAYVCVPERQKRGAIHFHLAVKGYYHWNTVRNFWRQSINGSGNVDFQRRKDQTGKYVVDARRIAGYMAKYITKQETVQFNKKRYASTRIDLPEPIRGWLALGVSASYIVCELVRRMARFPITTYWESEDGYLPIILART